MRFKFIIIAALTALCFAAPGAANAQDGDPTPTPKPVNCVNIDLDGGEDYIATAQNQNECVTGGTGQNVIWLFSGNDWANGNGDVDEIHGQDQQDSIFGGKEGDRIFGEGGNDFLRAGCPNGCDITGQVFADLIEGGDGSDNIGACNGFRTVVHGGQGDTDVGYVDKNKDDWSGLEIIHFC